MLITHSTFLLTCSSEMRLDRIQVDLWHCCLDVINVEATFNRTRMSNVKIFYSDNDVAEVTTETAEQKLVSPPSRICNLEWPIKN